MGLSNWRRPAAGPSGDLAFTFSNNPATPQIAYVYTGSQLVRLNTATNQVQNTGNFPKSGGGGWLQQDKNDAWFVYTSGPDQVTAWNSQTNQTLPRTFAGLDEPRLERDGRYAAVIAGSGSVWVGSADEHADGGDAAGRRRRSTTPRARGGTSTRSTRT